MNNSLVLRENTVVVAHGGSVSLFDRSTIGLLFVSQQDGYSASFAIRGTLSTGIDGPFNPTGGTIWSNAGGTPSSNNIYLDADNTIHIENNYTPNNSTYKCFLIGLPTP